MQVSLEISLYPLDETYIKVIGTFIEKLKTENSLEVKVNPMSTQIFGDMDTIMQLLNTEMRIVWEKYPAVFVMKWVGRNLLEE